MAEDFLYRGSKAVGPMSWIYSMLKNPTSMKEIILSEKFATISCQVSPDLLLRVSAGIC
jgi:hypothetical protein